jgi:hypothetical protein
MYLQLALSPDGERAALARPDDTQTLRFADLYLLDFQRHKIDRSTLPYGQSKDRV